MPSTGGEADEPVPEIPILPVLPIAAGVAAWAIAMYTRTSLGAWRFLLVVPLTAYAVYTGAMFLVFGIASRVLRSADVPAAQADQAGGDQDGADPGQHE